MLFLFFKVFLIIFSALDTILSLIFTLSPPLFSKIEGFLGMEFGGKADIINVLNRKINFFNDWVYGNRKFFGPLLALLAALNTRNACFL